MQKLIINLKEFYEFMLNRLIESEDYEKASSIKKVIDNLSGEETIEYYEPNIDLNNGEGINTK